MRVELLVGQVLYASTGHWGFTGFHVKAVKRNRTLPSADIPPWMQKTSSFDDCGFRSTTYGVKT